MPGFRDIIHIERVVDISGLAAEEGFLAPVAVSRKAYDHQFRVWSPCACPECEEGAKNATRDRIERALRALLAAIESLEPGDASQQLDFTLDIPLPRPPKGRRRVVALRATLGPSGADYPVVTITERHEHHAVPLTDLQAPREPSV